jgi:hypothetical protein
LFACYFTESINRASKAEVSERIGVQKDIKEIHKFSCKKKYNSSSLLIRPLILKDTPLIKQDHRCTEIVKYD